MPSRPQHRQFKARRWPIWLGMVAVVALVAAIAWFGLGRSATPGTAPPSLPPPTITASWAPAPSPDPSESVSSAPEPFPASRALQIYVPSSRKEFVISDPVLPMDSSCMPVIQPPLSGPTVGSVFQCMDFAMPGPTAPDLAILAGHSSLHLDTVFNKLYRQGETLEGREVWLRTATSGKRWLVYRIQRTYEPLKTELPYMTDVWGTPQQPASGRLVLVTCLQNADGSDSVRNFIAVAQYVETR